MMSETIRWAAPLALPRGLLVGLCVYWPSYTSAEGTQRDPSQAQTPTADAVEAIRLAAEQGDADAQVDLGLMYAISSGVSQDETEAGRWYRLAAEQGVSTSVRVANSVLPAGKLFANSVHRGV